jgi:hypothetical protein
LAQRLQETRGCPRHRLASAGLAPQWQILSHRKRAKYTQNAAAFVSERIASARDERPYFKQCAPRHLGGLLARDIGTVLRSSLRLATFILATFIAQLLNVVQPLSDLVSMMLAAA